MDAQTKRIVNTHRKVMSDHPNQTTIFQIGCTADRLFLLYKMEVSDDEIIAAMEQAQD